MKNVLMKKTAALIVSLMIVSALLPIAAFANGFGSVTSLNGKVTGTVYVEDSTYQLLDDQQTIAIQVYSNAGAYLGAVDAAYGYSSAAGTVYYDFTIERSQFAANENIVLQYYYPVSSTVVANVYSDSIYRSLSNSGGGGIFFPPTNSGDSINAWSDGRVDATALATALADGEATVNITGNVALLPASALTADGTVTIVNADGATYKLPLSVLDLSALADALGIDIDDLVIRVEINVLEGETAAAVEAAATAIGGTQVAGAYDYKVVAVGDDEEIEINNFGSTYVERSLPLNKVATSDQVTGVLYNPATGEFSFVPATFATNDGITTATLKRNGNSVYTVLELDPKVFTDLVSHWAQEDVETLASKLVVEGVNDTLFQPGRNITRAEFAAMIVRSLSLDTTATTAEFSDVPAGQWFAGAVAAAADAGIVQGYPDGTFNPQANITRKELAAMVVRALAYAGEEVTLTDAQVSSALAPYTDVAALGWAEEEVAAAIQSGIVLGQSATRVAGEANATRAEAATMVTRFLTGVNFIN
ncbi:S-layer homology domain-containing protein [Paenibacillus sp. IB182496]|uniref:S-layer homology domain-containing protein n=1 Tax=Paenibacillus sabuli TaxID=2772509 RepID=A0A927BTC9_9BACL|nr:S-layer homology domain-containing protein [Paenibacillus sabuli]MBD2845932.1 S-layer homology domain-containing protein [Paenibacillus sabuli]